MRNILSILLCIALISACSGNPDCSGCSDENAEHGPRPATGLSNQCVYDIAEDTSGQIWIATFRGLNRYDSRDFYHYFSDYPDSLSLPSNQVRDLLIDHKGRLLIASVAGVCRHTESDNFHTFPELRHQMALNMIKGPDSLVFILASNAIYSLDVRTDSIETLIDSLNLPMTDCPSAHGSGQPRSPMGKRFSFDAQIRLPQPQSRGLGSHPDVCQQRIPFR